MSTLEARFVAVFSLGDHDVVRWMWLQDMHHGKIRSAEALVSTSSLQSPITTPSRVSESLV